VTVEHAERETDWRRLARRGGWNALSPDGMNVLSGSTDGAARLWDIDTGKVITKWLAAGGDGDLEDTGFIKTWNANTGKLVGNAGFTEPVLCLGMERRLVKFSCLARSQLNRFSLGLNPCL
jgi:WD40 repeat protein